MTSATTRGRYGRRVLQVRHPAAHGVVWDRTPPAEWVARLEQVIEPEGNSWLMLRWEPGEAWWPIERWALWQVRTRETAAMLYPDHLAELEGPNPRGEGHACFPGWCHDCKDEEDRPRHAMRWKRDNGPAFIDYWQWKFYQETGLFGTRWWVIQGSEGGNRWKLSYDEQKLRELKRQPMDIPWPGQQPYAPFDERVVQAIVREDKLRRGLLARQDMRQIAAMRDRLEAMEQAAREDAARSYATSEEERLADSASEFTRRYAAFHGDPRGPVTTREDRVKAGARFERAFEETVQGLV